MDLEYSISLVLMSESYLSSLCLPIRSEGKYYFIKSNGQNVDFIFIESMNGCWKVHCRKQAYIQEADQKLLVYTLHQGRNFLRIQYEGQERLLYAEYMDISQRIYKKYFILEDSSLEIGRSDDCDIRFHNNFVSRHHAVLRYERKNWVVEDSGSMNGVFVDGARIEVKEKKQLLLGNKINILNFQILIGTNFLAISGSDESIFINSEKLKSMDRMRVCGDEVADRKGKQETTFTRLPWQRKKQVLAPIELEAPPLSMNSSQVPLILRMGGSMVMGGSAMLSGHFASVLSMLLFPMLNSRYSEKEKKEYEEKRKRKYREYLEKKRLEIQDEKRSEEIYLNQTYPIGSKLLEYLQNEEKLWGRRKTDDDFLYIRIGNGRKPLLAELQYPRQKFTLEMDELEKEMYHLAEEKVMIEHIPILLHLTENYVSSITGKEELKIQFFTYLMAQITFWHSYDEVKLLFLLDEKLLQKFEYIRYLPHVWDEEKTFRFIATDISSGYLIGEYLSRQVQDDIEKGKNLKKILKARPYYVVFAWNKRIFDALEVLGAIQNEEQNVGVSILTFFEEVPQNTHELISLTGGSGNLITYLRNPEDGKQEFELDFFKQDRMRDMFRKISNIVLKNHEQEFVLPKMLSFLEMLAVGKVEYLNVTKRWKENNPSQSLAVPVGVADDGSWFMLDLHEKYHGPHGLVAGMTGSGKSEFLITYILSLAVNFHPDEVAFVLIDYKGGGLAGAFEDTEKGIHLPHLVGTITNLDGASIQRSLMSIESEMKRRQRIFNEAKSMNDEGTMDIYLYQTLYRLGKVKEPLPHLFIISDEFAELKSQEPEFMDQLVSAARIGRSLGVHLILATQKPAGVVNDQISSNSKFRVCLKVQTRADSDEMRF